jgi:hypothetical protein
MIINQSFLEIDIAWKELVYGVLLQRHDRDVRASEGK